MTSAQESFALQLSRLETEVAAAAFPQAFNTLLRLLRRLGSGFGAVETSISPQPWRLGTRESALASRLAYCAGAILTAPDFEVTLSHFRRAIDLHRWLHVAFGASGFHTADFALARLNLPVPGDASSAPDRSTAFKATLLTSAETNGRVDFAALFARYPVAAMSLAFAIASQRFVGTPVSYPRRETALRFLTAALDKVPSLEALPIDLMVDLYMHCSYADYREKHALKGPLNALLRKRMLAEGFKDCAVRGDAEGRTQTVFVILEWFRKGHSILRTHSLSMKALRERYRLVGFGRTDLVDEVGQAVFDAFVPIASSPMERDAARIVTEWAEREKPLGVYYPSMGMAPHTIILSNLRFAPTQIIALGHPATTHSSVIDHVVVEKDYLGDPSLFSENVVAVPPRAIPYLEPEAIEPGPETSQTRAKRNALPVKIAVASFLMKLNPTFLGACRRIAETASVPVEFHFLVGASSGLTTEFVRKAIAAQTPNAVVHSHSPYAEYAQRLAACDMFINPFPFGNTNGIVDAVAVGLPGVCWSGPEVHSHIDEGLFGRMGFPDWTVTYDLESYVAAAVRMAESPEIRLEIGEDMARRRPDRQLYEGDPSAFLETFQVLLEGHGARLAEAG